MNGKILYIQGFLYHNTFYQLFVEHSSNKIMWYKVIWRCGVNTKDSSIGRYQ
jgi:hypothetical protein